MKYTLRIHATVKRQFRISVLANRILAPRKNLDVCNCIPVSGQRQFFNNPRGLREGNVTCPTHFLLKRCDVTLFRHVIPQLTSHRIECPQFSFANDLRARASGKLYPTEQIRRYNPFVAALAVLFGNNPSPRKMCLRFAKKKKQKKTRRGAWRSLFFFIAYSKPCLRFG